MMNREQVDRVLRAVLETDLGYNEDAIEEAVASGWVLSQEDSEVLSMSLETALEEHLPAGTTLLIDGAALRASSWESVLDHLEDVVRDATD